MISKKIFELLQNSKKSYFSVQELTNYLGINKSVLKVTLSRMVKQKKLVKLGLGYYCLPQKTADLEELATEINYPSYLSLEHALAVHGVLSQVPARITLITKKRSSQYNVGDRILEYTHIKPSLFFGYDIAGQIQIARPEKALLDELYLIGLKKRKLDIREFDLTNINRKLFNKWLKFYPPSTANLSKELKFV